MIVGKDFQLPKPTKIRFNTIKTMKRTLKSLKKCLRITFYSSLDKKDMANFEIENQINLEFK